MVSGRGLENAASNVAQFAASLTHAKLADYRDDELVWAGENGDLDEPSGRLKSEEIILAVQNPWSERGYLVCSLSEAPDGASDDAKPFTLSGLCVPALPQALLDSFLVHGTPMHLACDVSHQLHVVVSTGSGLQRAQAFYSDVLQPLLAALGLAEGSASMSGTGAPPDGYEVMVTQNPRSIHEFARGLVQSDAGDALLSSRTIVLLSGDGGVVDLLNGCDEATSPGQQQQQRQPNRPTVALLPLGTGNALFHSLHKSHYAVAEGKSAPSPFVLGLRTLVRGSAAPLPTFDASFSPRSRLVSYTDADVAAAAGKETSETSQPEQHWPVVSHLLGAIVASYGFHASLVWESDTPAYRVHGSKRFGMAAQELLKVSHAYDCSVEVIPASGPGPGSGDGKQEKAGWTALAGEQQRFNYVLATLVSNLEKTFTISPASRPLDGQLRLVWFGDVGGQRTMEIMMAAYRDGQHVDMRWTADGEEAEQKVGYEAVDGVRVTLTEEDPRWRKVCIDGTIVELERGGWMEVRTVPAERARLQVLV